MVNERYDQPFFVGFGKYAIWWTEGKEHRRFREFRHQSADGYLEALEPRIDDTEPPPEQIIIHRQSSMSVQESDMLQQAWRKIDRLQKKLEEKEKKKPGSKYQQYKVDNPPK